MANGWNKVKTVIIVIIAAGVALTIWIYRNQIKSGAVYLWNKLQGKA